MTYSSTIDLKERMEHWLKAWVSRDVEIFAEPRGGVFPRIFLAIGLVSIALGLIFPVLPTEQFIPAEGQRLAARELNLRLTVIGGGIFNILQGVSDLLPTDRTTLAGRLRVGSYSGVLLMVAGVIIEAATYY